MQYGDYLSYVQVDEDEDGTYDYVEISDCDESATEIIIPSEIDGLPVTTIMGGANGAFGGCTSLTSIEIPDSVTSIGSSAFYETALLNNQTGVKYADTWVVDCDQDVETAVIKDGTRGINDSVFSNCKNLASIKIPDSVTSIGDKVFSGCTSLTSIIIQNPECEISDSKLTICNYNPDIGECYDGTIYGYKNSTAQKYAEKCGYKFAVIGEEPVVTTPVITSAVTTNETTVSTTVSSVTSNTEKTNVSSDSTSTSVSVNSSSTENTTTAESATTSTEVTTISGTVTTSTASTIKGDSDGDGKVGVRDAAFIARMIAQGKAKELPANADYNGDGKVNVRDAAALARDIAQGKIKN